MVEGLSYWLCPSDRHMTLISDLTPTTAAADSLDLGSAPLSQIIELMLDCVRIDQFSYFTVPARGSDEYRQMISNRRRLERLRGALIERQRDRTH